MEFDGTSGNDDFVGTEKDDLFYLSGGGADVIQGRNGDDEVLLGQMLQSGSQFDGGKGDDTIIFGDVPDGFAFNGTNLAHFEHAYFQGQSAVRISIADACDPMGHHLQMDVFAGGSVVDASAVTGSLSALIGEYGSVQFTAGSGDDQIDSLGKRDIIDGGGGNDFLVGANGPDTLTGGSGADTFAYYVFSGRNEVGKDIVTDFDVSQDTILITSNHLHRYSQLMIQDDGHGGTIVFFKGRESADLENVAFGTLSKSNFSFAQPSPQTTPNSEASWRSGFDPGPPHATLGATMGAHGWHDDLHTMGHIAIV